MAYDHLIICARSWYDVNWKNRQYHNWAHANEVATSVRVLDEKASPELIMAAYWHDAVYVPGAGSDANERCSAAALGQEGRIFSDPTTVMIIEKAKQLILYTKVETHLHESRITGDLAILLDADLSSFAISYEGFIEHQKNIIAENGGTYGEHQQQSAAFLKLFLECRTFIYHTDYARSNWEQTARENIERYCKE